MKGFYRGIISFGDILKHFFLLGLRAYWGYSFFTAGWAKLGNIEAVAESFSSLTIPLPLFNAYLVGGVECIGGLFLLIGFASRLAAIPLAFTMIVALFSAHLNVTLGMFENPQAFINQLPFNYLLASLAVICFGPGAFSIDAIIKHFILKGK